MALARISETDHITNVIPDMLLYKDPLNFVSMTQREEGSYFCHIIIPSRNLTTSRIFFERVFGWKVEAAPGTNSLDVLPPSGKGISAELSPEEETIVPSIYTTDIEGKLELIEESGGRKLRGKSRIDDKGEQGYYALFLDPEGNKMCLYSDK